jgi:hypothetical protein
MTEIMHEQEEPEGAVRGGLLLALRGWRLGRRTVTDEAQQRFLP